MVDEKKNNTDNNEIKEWFIYHHVMTFDKCYKLCFFVLDWMDALDGPH